MPGTRGQSDKVVQRLGRDVVRGVLLPGKAIPTEEVLAAELGIGRSAVREGVKVLSGKGLLQARTSAGTRVQPRDTWTLLDHSVLEWRFSPEPDESDVQVLADLRVALEPGAARLAAERGDARGYQAIAEAMAAQYATVEEPDAFIDADLAFHRAVFAASHNDLLLHMYGVIGIALSSVRRIHVRSIDHNRETLPHHERVASAIRLRHHRKAEEAMREIVEIARRDACSSLFCCGGSA